MSRYGTLTDAFELKFPMAFRANPHPLVSAVAQFAQYVLIVTGVLWEARRERGLIGRGHRLLR